MSNDFPFFLLGRMIPPYVLAAHIHVCAPETALKHVCPLEMRQWYEHMPGILFRFGFFRFPGEFPRVYQGGLTKEKSLFLLVPHALFERRRRFLLFHFARERLGSTTNPALIHRYCRQAEKELAEGRYSSEHPAFCAEAQARQVHEWVRFLAYRQEKSTPDWRW